MIRVSGKQIFLFLAWGLLCSSIPLSSQGIESITISGADRSECDLIISDFGQPSTTADLDIECFSDVFKIHIQGPSKQKYSVAFRYETSITVQNEGPHLDLVNWKHYRSPWVSAQVNQINQFVCKLPKGLVSKKFPKVEISEVRKALAKEDPSWLDLIKRTKSVTEYPLDVGISRIYFRVYVNQGKTQRLVKTIRYNISLGC